MEHEKEHFDDLPRGLIEDLKATEQAVSLITTKVDRELAAEARAHFASRRGSPRIARPAWIAVAATVLIALFVVDMQAPLIRDPTTIYTDVDESGRIDIADVLALARSREGGAITQAELDAFAMQIVSLRREGETP